MAAAQSAAARAPDSVVPARPIVRVALVASRITSTGAQASLQLLPALFALAALARVFGRAAANRK